MRLQGDHEVARVTSQCTLNRVIHLKPGRERPRPATLIELFTLLVVAGCLLATTSRSVASGVLVSGAAGAYHERGG